MPEIPHTASFSERTHTSLQMRGTRLNPDQRGYIDALLFKMKVDGQRINAMTVARRYNREVRAELDWHLFSPYLDDLRMRGILRIIQHDDAGMAHYALND